MEESFKQAPIYVLNAVQQNLTICNGGGEIVNSCVYVKQIVYLGG